MNPPSCPTCGTTLVGPQCELCEERQRSAAVHREFVVLLLLIAIAVSGFVVTRTVARLNRELRLHDAASWYRTGQQQLAARQSEDAVRALRRAAAIDRDNQSYQLALAAALAAGTQDDAARQVLVGLRERAPESTEINLQLARIEARRGNVTDAVRYYQNALYGILKTDDPEARRQIRVELIRYLLQHGRQSRALSELLVLASNAPDNPAAEIEIGQLFMQAGEPRRALDYLRRALRLEPANDTALAAAAQAAFALGDYSGADRYLRDLPVNEAIALRTITRLVLTRDPLLPKLSVSERTRRAQENLSNVVAHLDACVASATARSDPRADAFADLRGQVQAFANTLEPKTLRQTPDSLYDLVGLLARIEDQIAKVCGAPDDVARALVLIARRHDLDPSS